jgi:hypothetical protein
VLLERRRALAELVVVVSVTTPVELTAHVSTSRRPLDELAGTSMSDAVTASAAAIQTGRCMVSPPAERPQREG